MAIVKKYSDMLATDASVSQTATHHSIPICPLPMSSALWVVPRETSKSTPENWFREVGVCCQGLCTFHLLIRLATDEYIWQICYIFVTPVTTWCSSQPISCFRLCYTRSNLTSRRQVLSLVSRFWIVYGGEGNNLDCVSCVTVFMSCIYPAELLFLSMEYYLCEYFKNPDWFFLWIQRMIPFET